MGGGVAEVAGARTDFRMVGSVKWEPITGDSLAHCLKDLFQDNAVSAMARTSSRRRRMGASKEKLVVMGLAVIRNPSKPLSTNNN